MRVSDWMTPDPVAVGDHTTVAAARALMQAHGIRHLPILREGRVVGVLSERDLREMRPWLAVLAGAARGFQEAVEATEVGAIMSRTCQTIGPDAPIEEAARLMHDARVGALPVVRDAKLVGVLTVTDLLAILMAILGAGADAGREVLPLVAGGPPLWEWLWALAAEGRIPTRVATIPSRDGGALQLVVRTEPGEPQRGARS